MSNGNQAQRPLEPFKVYVRLRPFLPREIEQIETKPSSISAFCTERQSQSKSIFSKDDNILFVVDPTVNHRKDKAFAFDAIYDDNQSNAGIFQSAIKPIVNNVLEGYNSTALAYGVTGTGKTHTIFGEIGCNNNESIGIEKGIVMYASDYLFEKASEMTNKNICVKMSYLEIYNETVIDLLNPIHNALMIVEDNVKGINVPDLNEFTVGNSEELKTLILEGNSRRTMGSTNQNQFSSRSHAIIQLTVEQRHKSMNINDEIIFSKMLIVDLAGSERGGLEKGVRRDEGANINKSLLSLSNCINILSDKTKHGAFIPYRDSKLTRLLKDSLGGNIQTVLFACIGPSPMMYDESVNTLNYATRVRKIQKKVTKNLLEATGNVSQYKTIIDTLKTEITSLKDVIKTQEKKINERISTTTSSNRINTTEFVLEKGLNTIDLFNTPEYKQMVDTINDIDISYYKDHLVYEKAIQDNDYDNNNTHININELHSQIVDLKRDKLSFESFFDKFSQSTPEHSDIVKKYNEIKTIHEKYLELINDKLISNIEECMVMKFNLKEINDLSATNLSNIKTLHAKMVECSNKKEQKILSEEIDNLMASMKENDKEKNKIHDSYGKCIIMKKGLKKALLDLLTVNTTSKVIDSHYTILLKEKEDLQITTKNYEKRIISIISEKNQKDEQLSEVQKELIKLQNELIKKDKAIEKLTTNKATSNYNSVGRIPYHKISSANDFRNNIQHNINCLRTNVKRQRSTTPPPNQKNRINSKDSSSKNSNVQNIKYIINQTNNILNGDNLNKNPPRRTITPTVKQNEHIPQQKYKKNSKPRTHSQILSNPSAPSICNNINVKLNPFLFKKKINNQPIPFNPSNHQSNYAKGNKNSNYNQYLLKKDSSFSLSIDENLCLNNQGSDEKTFEKEDQDPIPFDIIGNSPIHTPASSNIDDDTSINHQETKYSNKTSTYLGLHQARLKKKMMQNNHNVPNQSNIKTHTNKKQPLNNAENFINEYHKMKETTPRDNDTNTNDFFTANDPIDSQKTTDINPIQFDTNDDKVNMKSINECHVKEQLCASQLTHCKKDTKSNDMSLNTDDYFLSIVQSIPNPSKLTRFLHLYK